MRRRREGRASGGTDQLPPLAGPAVIDEVGPPRPPLPLPWPPLAVDSHRLTLRPWGSGPDDAGALHHAWSDPAIARWTDVPEAHDVADAERWIAGERERRESGHALDLVVASLDDPAEVLGEVGLVLVEPRRLWAEVGYWVATSARGRGVGAAALRAFTDFALVDLPINTIYARTHPDNPAAARTAQGAGYQLAGTLEGGTEVWTREARRS